MDDDALVAFLEKVRDHNLAKDCQSADLDRWMSLRDGPKNSDDYKSPEAALAETTQPTPTTAQPVQEYDPGLKTITSQDWSRDIGSGTHFPPEDVVGTTAPNDDESFFQELECRLTDGVAQVIKDELTQVTGVLFAQIAALSDKLDRLNTVVARLQTMEPATKAKSSKKPPFKCLHNGMLVVADPGTKTYRAATYAEMKDVKGQLKEESLKGFTAK